MWWLIMLDAQSNGWTTRDPACFAQFGSGDGASHGYRPVRNFA
jgi:hypothetical protein